MSPLRATRDTFGIEIEGGAEVRRQVKAGDIIPPGITVDDGDAEEVGNDVARTVGLGEPVTGPVEADKEEEARAQEQSGQTAAKTSKKGSS